MSTPHRTKETLQYIDLYFDLERLKSKLIVLEEELGQAAATMTHIYAEEYELIKAGKTPDSRVGLDIGTRGALAASISIIFPQLGYLMMSAENAQRACTVICPQLQTNSKLEN
jgi:hypothetical protein